MGLFLAATWLDTFVDATARAAEARNQGWEKAQGNQCNYQVEPDLDLTFGHFYICQGIEEGVSFVKANCKYKRRKSAQFNCSILLKVKTQALNFYGLISIWISSVDYLQLHAIKLSKLVSRSKEMNESS